MTHRDLVKDPSIKLGKIAASKVLVVWWIHVNEDMVAAGPYNNTSLAVGCYVRSCRNQCQHQD